MSSSHDAAGHAAHDESHSPRHYVKIWAVLVVLLVVSVTGPMLGIRWVTLLTAFGIAFVKAFLVVKHFMHLTVEKKVAQYAIGACLALMVLFFFAISPDILKHFGDNWENRGAANMKAVIAASEKRHEELELADEPGGHAAEGAKGAEGEKAGEGEKAPEGTKP
jgi:caa(3)-type oxidase subunit IV